MVVTIHFHTVLQQQPAGRLDRLEVALPEGSPLSGLVERIGIVFPLDALILVVNGRLAALDQILEDRDQVHLIPAIIGG